VIDGGKGQLNAALKAAKLETLNSKSETNSKQQAQNSVQKTQTNSRGLVKDEGFPPKAERIKVNAIPMLGLAKRIEEIFLPGKKTPIILSHDNPALQLLQRLRDEAHRFAITFHRQKRGKLATRSALDDIPGIGPKTKKLLKKHFGTLSEIKKANPEELEKVIGQAKTTILQKQLP
jgi:excinuclease UvrABC nuclease subunit